MARSAAAKTQPTQTTLEEFLATSIAPERHGDCLEIADMMRAATGEAAVMWGNIVGFGRYQYHYESGRVGEWPVVAFAPRKNDLVLYIMPGFEHIAAQLAALGKHKTGKSCLYIKRLADVDNRVLKTIIDGSVHAMAAKRLSS